jgi:hypothetical protein
MSIQTPKKVLYRVDQILLPRSLRGRLSVRAYRYVEKYPKKDVSPRHWRARIYKKETPKKEKVKERKKQERKSKSVY